jgi:hypothetical protein
MATAETRWILDTVIGDAVGFRLAAVLVLRWETSSGSGSYSPDSGIK